MNISLVKAKLKDSEVIHKMQIESFSTLLNKYEDFETNPGNEPLEKIINRIKQPFTDYYIVNCDNISIGCIRIVKMDNKHYRISPIFILPEYQGRGVAQKVFNMVEEIYYYAKVWELDTILQEEGNCYLYEKLGYKKTGETKVINDKLTLVFYEKSILRMKIKDLKRCMKKVIYPVVK
ncbi:GNAT family N-acetyltransferase [Clostridium gasigenes]|uniref:GNAT family N-acetyltransferase n=1 Tax=Clostridium gasigenes TaxID=94869 RepID=UPI001C0AFE3E|nr:GNAT family N-acetyltransferase [Clostridium gasigenes]MBU3134847.1 GNAT family N-acetyltransferase [Clostridium gasigenes]